MEKTNFFQNVHDVVREIPLGRVTTYGAIAKYLGTGKSARMVGWALNQAGLKLPVHRVVNRIGLLTGKHNFPAENSMEKRLSAEGILVEDGHVVNFEALFWDPKLLDEQYD